jgi:hypothetical protein
MKWFERLKQRIICFLLKVFGMKLPIKKDTGLIDIDKVSNVTLHFDGEVYFFTALVKGNLVFIKFSNELWSWFKLSGIHVVHFSDIWEMPMPENVTIMEYENIPKITSMAKLK